MEASQFIMDDELTDYVNQSYAELYDLLVAKFEDYFVEDPLDFSVASGVSKFPLPADLYKIIGVDKALGGGEYYALRPFSFEARNKRRVSDRLRGLYPQVRYRIIGDDLKLSPDDQAPGDYRIWYVPSYTPLVLDVDTVASVISRNGWEEYIVIDAAIKCLQKEESDVSVLFAQKQAMAGRIEEMAQNRDAGDTDRITDVTLSGFDDTIFYG